MTDELASTSQARPSPAPTAPSVRYVAGRYRVEARIGAGGMGVVWRGYDETLRRPVALKEVIIPFGMVAADAAALRERYLREARAAAQLRHPNVVGLYDVLEEASPAPPTEDTADDTTTDPGRVWIVMELLDADNLSEVLRRDGRLDPIGVAKIGLQLTNALSSSHAAGVLHRDVKPANVMISRSTEEEFSDGTHGPRAVLTDFGVAAISGDPTLTRTGQLIGSPVYLPPERLVSGGIAGPKGDLWALGCTLFAAVEGKPPFYRKDQIEVITAIAVEPVPRPENAGPLSPILAGLLEKDPQTRWDVARTRTALQRVIAGQAVESTASWGASPTPNPATTGSSPFSKVASTQSGSTLAPAPPPKKPARRRHRVLAAITAAVAVLAVVAGVAYQASAWPFNDRNETHASDGSTEPADNHSFTHPDYGYTVHYPANWSQECNRPAQCQFEPPPDLADPTELRMFVSVERATNGTKLTAERASRAESLRNREAGRFDGYDEIANKHRRIGPHNGWWLEYTFVNSQSEPRDVMVFRIADSNGLVYALSLNGSEDQVTENEQVLQDAAASFKLPARESSPSKTTARSASR